MLRSILVALGVAAVATIVAVAVLWPRGGGRQAAVSQADSMGLVTERFHAKVVSVLEGPCSYSSVERPHQCRTITFRADEGPDAGTTLTLPEFNLTQSVAAPDVSAGDAILVGYEPSTTTYFFADLDRSRTLWLLAGIFTAVVLAFGRGRGVLALVAMALSVAVLVGFVAPSVLDGHDPLLVSVVAASAIAFISLLLTHGPNPTTTVALAGTIGALGLTLAITWSFFRLARFTGLATEEALTLPFVVQGIDLPALLLGGAVLGALGALDDVTVTQVAAVAELRQHNPALSTSELMASGIRVGREHIASTVNTLLLAYAGASMPLLLLFAVSGRSVASIANSEVIAIEIVRTLCGSIGLVAAVPLTTMLAAALLSGGPIPTASPPQRPPTA